MSNLTTITRQALKEKVDKKEDFVLIDVLGETSYKRAHLPGAISIDAHQDDFVAQVEKQVPDKDKEVVVYCSSFSCQLSPTAARKLVHAGYTRIIDFDGGLKDWAEAGYSFEGNEAEEMARSLKGDL